jgi:hydrogenase maturation protease
MTPPRILIAGIGNVFLGDDGFGVAVVQRLAARTLPEGVRAVDFGVRGFDLTYTLLEGYDAAILVDAAHRDGPPGTLYVLEPDPAAPDAEDALDTHGMTPARVLDLVRAMGGVAPLLRVVGCEPATFGDDEPTVGLSEPVEAAVDAAVGLVEELCAHIQRGGAAHA